MSQHDFTIDNASGAAARADINSALQALASNNAGPTEPATTYAYMLWPDVTTSLLKMRDGSNTEWISLGDFTLANLGHLTSYFPTGTKLVFYQAAPPTGWTKDTSNNDKALRVVSNAGGGSGGIHGLSAPPSTIHTHVGPSHVHAGPSHVHAGPSHAHGLSLSVSVSIAGAPHQTNAHRWFDYGDGDEITSFDGHGHPGSTASASGSATAGGTEATGAGGTGATGAGGTEATGSAAPTAFYPKYIDVIVGIKD